MPFGSADPDPQSIAKGYVELAHYPDAPVVAPVLVARGARPGPSLYIQNLVHGPEIVGPISTARFLRSLNLQELKGTISALLVANPLGLRGYNRLTPQDGANLNRVFPGDPEGSLSEQLAARLLGLADAHGDVLVDLHSGGDLSITPFYVIHHGDDSSASRESARLAASVGSRFQWASSEPWMRGSAITNFTLRYGKPALIVESGGGARVTDTDFANFRTALTGLCQAMGMLEGEPPRMADIRRGGNAVHVKCTRGGFWHPAKAPGDDMVRDDVMGTIVDPFGDTVETVLCPMERAWVGSIRRPFMPLYSGDQVMEVVQWLA